MGHNFSKLDLLPSSVAIFIQSELVQRLMSLRMCLYVHIIYTGVLINHQPDQEGNKLQRQKIMMFIYPIYCHNWRNISTIYMYNKTSIKRNILTIKQNTVVLISPQPDQEGNKLQRQKNLIFIYLIYNHNWRNINTIYIYIYNNTSIKRNIVTIKQNRGVLISPQPNEEGNELQRQKILMFIYPIYCHNWRNISTINIYNKTSIKRNILTIKQNTGVLISPQPDQEGNKLQRQKILSFIYPIYNHNWRNITKKVKQSHYRPGQACNGIHTVHVVPRCRAPNPCLPQDRAQYHTL